MFCRRLNGKCQLILTAVFLLSVFSGCKHENDNSIEYHAEELKTDERYLGSIDFAALDIAIPLDDKNTFIRIDEPVSDMDAYHETILTELSVPLKNCRFHYSNEAIHGRTMTLYFGDGKKCAFIWVADIENPIRLMSVLNHEKYHALCKLAPKNIDDLNDHVKTLGFSFNLRDYHEELAATLVEVLTFYCSEIDLGSISGSELVIQAVEILKKTKNLK